MWAEIRSTLLRQTSEVNGLCCFGDSSDAKLDSESIPGVVMGIVVPGSEAQSGLPSKQEVQEAEPPLRNSTHCSAVLLCPEAAQLSESVLW